MINPQTVNTSLQISPQNVRDRYKFHVAGLLEGAPHSPSYAWTVSDCGNR